MQIDLGIPGLADLVELGRGGSAVVYKAWQESLNRHVAVKVIHASGDEGVERRFNREVQAMGRLSEHPGIAQVHSTGRTRTGELYLIMPYYSDGALAERLRSQQPMPWEEATELMDHVASTIGDAHDAGIVHRDIKPANILLTSAGEPRVADFGISFLTSAEQSGHSSTPTFTPYFAAPESFQVAGVSPTVDVYSLGATLYALLAGQPPFRSADGPNDILSVMKRATDEPIADLGPGVPNPLAALVSRAMSKDPNKRPANGNAFLAELRAATHEAATGEASSTIIPPGARSVQQESEVAEAGSSGPPRWLLPIAAAAVVLAALAWIGLRPDTDDASASTETTVPGAPRVIGLDVVDLTDTTARVVYRGDVCTGTVFVIEGVGQGASGYPNADNCADSHQLLLGRAPFTPGLLEPDSKYTVSVEVFDEQGRKSATESIEFTTDERYPDDRAVGISGFSLTEMTSTSVKVAFSTDLCAGSRFYLDDELLHGDGYPDNAWCWNQHPFLIGITSEPLEPNSSHTVKVEAVSRAGVVTVEERAFTTNP